MKFGKIVCTAALLGASYLGADDLRKDEGVTTIRESIGNVVLIEHAVAQIRAGHIFLDSRTAAAKNSSAAALGGHIHLRSKRYFGILAAAELYTVQDMGIQRSDPAEINGDFFGTRKSGYSTLSQAYIDAEWGGTRFKAGRQLIDTPHADSDDIRMMPNYFMAYTLTNTDIEALTLTAGKIGRMAGWENGGDASKFLNIGRAFGAAEETDGIYFASALYSGWDESVLQAWLYRISDIANLLYLEAARELYTEKSHTVIGIQYEKAAGSGRELLGTIDSSTWGVTAQMRLLQSGLLFTAAFNRASGAGGAFGSLGGGPFFTSLEDQTLDAIGTAGRAWIAGVSYDFSQFGIEGLEAGTAYGSFRADDSSVYNTAETDLTLTYELSDALSLTAACAFVNDKTLLDTDYTQFRFVANYNFRGP